MSFSSVIGRGLPLPTAKDFKSFLLAGMPVIPGPPKNPPANARETVRQVRPGDRLPGNIPGSQLLSISPAVLRDAAGQVIVPTADGYVPIGDSQLLSFDDETLQGRITPSLSGKVLDDLSLYLGDAPLSFTGSDVRIMLEIQEPPRVGDAKPRFAKQLIECHTITVSIHRIKTPARAAGYHNPKGFARGTRTIAGTLILTQFTVEVLMRFLQGVLLKDDAMKDSHFSKPDQLPPFNMTLVFTNEQGFASHRRLLGVEFVTDGSVYSSNDMFTEQTLSYMASDYTPLLPLTLSSMYFPQDYSQRNRQREMTVQDKWKTNRT